MSILSRLKKPERSWRYEYAFPTYARLPWRVAYAAAAAQGKLFYHKRQRERELNQNQLQLTFPEASSEQINAWLYDYFKMVEREALDTWFLQSAAIEPLVTLVNFEPIAVARAAGQKVLLTGGHFGRFWLAGPAMARLGHTVGTLTRDGGQTNQHGLHPAEYQYRLWKLQRLQAALGGPFLVEGDDLRPLYKQLDSHLITLLFDVVYPEIPAGCVTVPFLGGKIKVPAGIYRIAKKTKAMVAPFYVRDCGGGKVVVEFFELLDPYNYNDEDFMSLLAMQLDAQIRARPGHWWLWEALPLLRSQ